MFFNKTFMKFVLILLYTASFVTCENRYGLTKGDNALHSANIRLPAEGMLTLRQTEKVLIRRERIAPSGHKRLFCSKDVVILNKHNFKDKIQGSPAVWYVLFYLHWCGHCIKFSTTWTNVGRDTKGWSKYAHVAVIDCAEPGYGSLCEEYGIRGYPAIKIFEPNSDNDKGKKYKLKMDFENIIKSMVDTISKQAFKPHPFSPATRLSVSKALKSINNSDKKIALFFEKPDSYLGKKLVLDFSNDKHIHVMRVLNSQQDFMKWCSVTSTPAVYVIHKDGSCSHILVENKSLYSYRRALKKVANEKPTENNKALLASNHYRSTTVHLKDLVSTLRYMFHVEIPRSYTLRGSQFQALKDFISVLEQYFPDRKIRKSFTGLGNQLKGKESIEGNTLHFHISNLNLPKDITWVGCKGSETWFRGYPCGCWQLFHTLAVKSYNRCQTNLHSSKYILNSIIGYIKHFFGCKHCRENFVQMTPLVHKTVTTNKKVVLWLWEAHNQVNARLQGDSTEDPQHPKIQFPPKKMCSKCKDKDSQWNKVEVLKFLQQFYDKNLVKY